MFPKFVQLARCGRTVASEFSDADVGYLETFRSHRAKPTVI